MSDVRTFTISTRKAEGVPPVTTVLTVDMTGCPLSTKEALAISTLVVKRQLWYRKHGIPARDTVLMKDYAPGVRHTSAPPTPEEAKAILKAEFAKMTPEERTEALRRMMQEDFGG